MAAAWQMATDDSALFPGEVHVWRVPLDVTGWRDHLSQGGLGAEEIRRAESFRFEADQRRFVMGRVALRAILGAYLDMGGAELAFSAGPHGKPCLDARRHGTSLRFNLAGCPELALVAVSRDRELGVDVERCRPRRGLEALVARHLSPNEQRALGATPHSLRLKAFLGVWTLKEACLKASGEGLARRLRDLEVTVDLDEPARLLAVLDRPGDEARWTLRRLDPGTGYLGALAVEGGDWRLSTWHWPGGS